MGRNRLGKQYHVGRKFKILSQVENTDFSIRVDMSRGSASDVYRAHVNVIAGWWLPGMNLAALDTQQLYHILPFVLKCVCVKK